MSISERITSMETHISDDYEGLVNLGADLTGINKNIQNIKTVLDTVWTNLPKVSNEGTEITLTPTKKGKLQIQIKGNTTDNKNVTGNNNVVVSGNWFSSEMELGSITNSGVPATPVDTNCMRTKDYIEILPNTEYTIKNDKNYSNYMYYYDENYTFIERLAGTENPKTFTTPPNTRYVKTRTIASRTENDLTAKYMLNLGTTAIDYQPYTTPQTLPLNLGAIELEENDEIVNINGTYYINDITGTEITDSTLIEQLNAIDKMKSYNGTTIITSTYENGNAQMIINGSALKGEN